MPKRLIASASFLIFLLGVVQTLVLVKLVPQTIVAQFFLAQALIFFCVSVGNSTIMLKNFSQIVSGKREFNLYFFAYQVSVTLLASIVAIAYLIIETAIPVTVSLIVILISLMNANTSVTSFLRLYDSDFVKVQFLRAVMLAIRIVIVFVIALHDIDLIQLFLVYLFTDVVTTSTLLYLLYCRRNSFQLVIKKLRGTLGWGSVNSFLRELPRVTVFFLAEHFYAPQAIVDLRLILMARENLASMMSILSTVFYREIFERSSQIVFLTIFLVGFCFQLCFLFALKFSGLPLNVTLEVVVFYVSTSAAFGVVQQQWLLSKNDREKTQSGINAVAIGVMFLTTAPLFVGRQELALITYLTVFYVVWVTAILVDNGRFQKKSG